MDILDPRIERYMEERLRRFDEPVLLEMEAHAKENGRNRCEVRSFQPVAEEVGAAVEL